MLCRQELDPTVPQAFRSIFGRSRKSTPSVCRFIMMIKRGEFRDDSEKNAFVATMPSKAAKALKNHMETAKSRDFANF